MNNIVFARHRIARFISLLEIHLVMMAECAWTLGGSGLAMEQQEGAKEKNVPKAGLLRTVHNLGPVKGS